MTLILLIFFTITITIDFYQIMPFFQETFNLLLL